MLFRSNGTLDVHWLICLATHPFQIWLHVPNERPDKTDPAFSKPALYGIVEKKSMINLVSHITCSTVVRKLTQFRSKVLLLR